MKDGHLPEDVDEVKLLMRALTWIENYFCVAPEPVDWGGNWMFAIGGKLHLWVFPEPHPHALPEVRVELYTTTTEKRFFQRWRVTERLFVPVLMEIETTCKHLRDVQILTQ